MGTPQWYADTTYTFDLSQYNNVKAVVGGVQYMKSKLSGSGGGTEFTVKSCTYNPTTKQASLVINGGESSAIREWSGTCYVDVIQ